LFALENLLIEIYLFLYYIFIIKKIRAAYIFFKERVAYLLKKTIIFFLERK